MFSPNAQDFCKLVEVSFIAGINQTDIKSFINTGDNSFLKPDCLLSFPSDNTLITKGVLDFVFPCGVNFHYTEETPKFYSIILTNEKGLRSFIYLLKIYERIEYKDYIDKEITEIKQVESFIGSKKNLIKIDKNKVVYVPMTIGMYSYVSNTDAFKDILHESYRIITFNDKERSSSLSINDFNLVDNFRYCELMNYFILLGNILKPPTFTKMSINFHFSSLDFYFASNYELPPADSNIKILFDCLEISIIMKLWCSILTEKQIIIIANQAFLLYTICEALMKLIFPLKWVHTYIPVLPNLNSDLLDLPAPFIMGVLSYANDYEVLKEMYPSHIICDVDTSQIHATDCHAKLPSNEESKLRKKLQFVKNPEIFDIEEIVSKPVSKTTIIEDVNPNRTFSENVQYIFFRIFRKGLGGYNKKYMKDRVFDSALFLEDFSYISTEHEMFWERVVNTMAFEQFIQAEGFLDDSNTRIFKNIVKKTEDKNTNECYKFTINMPYYNLGKLFKEVNINLTNQDNGKLKINEKYLKDYNFIIGENLLQKTNIKNLPFKNAKIDKKHFRRNMSQDFDNSEHNFMLSSNSGFSNVNMTPNLSNKIDEKIIPCSILKNSVRSIGKDYCLKILNKNKDKNILTFYQSSGNKKQGFIAFINYLNDIISTNSKTCLLEYGIKNEIVNYIKEEINESCKTQDSPDVGQTTPMRKKISFYRIDEIVAELESDASDGFSRHLNTQNTNFTDNMVSSGNNFSYNNSSQSESILEFDHNNSFQYYQLLAIYMQQYSEIISNDIVSLGKNKLNDYILSLYKKAFQIDKKEFPMIKFYQFINHYDDIKILKLNREKLNSVTEKKLIKITDVKITKLSRQYFKKISIETKFDKNTLTDIGPLTTREKNILTGMNKGNSPIGKHIMMTDSDEKIDTPSCLIKLNRCPTNQTNDTSFFKEKSGSAQNDNKKVLNGSMTSRNADCGVKNNTSFLKAMKNAVKDDLMKIHQDKKISSEMQKKGSNSNYESFITEQKNPFKLADEKEKEKPELLENKSSLIRNSINNTTIDGKKYSNKNILAGLKVFDSVNNLMKINIINKSDKNIKNPISGVKEKSYKKGSISIDPLRLAEEIAVKMFWIIDKYSLNKFKQEALTTNILKEIAISNEMLNVRESINNLLYVNLTKFQNSKEKICFWLNIFNFLTILTLILKNELLSNHYEWGRFLKNSFFNIGGYELSLYEIENCILTNNFYSKSYGEEVKFNSTDPRKKWIIEEKSYLINFGISIPTKTSPNLKIYFPNELDQLLKENACEYCMANIILTDCTINISEFLLWIDPQFIEKIIDYKEYVGSNVYNYLSQSEVKGVSTSLFSWKTNFSFIKTSMG